MDETVAKREARRRRILENSERRLQRITDASEKVTVQNIQTNILDLETNGISVNKAFIEDENDMSYFQGDTIMKHRGNTSIKSCFGLNDEETSILSNSYKCNDIVNDKYGCTNKRSNVKHLGSQDESTKYFQEKNITNYHLQSNLCNKSLLSRNLLSNHISYVLLATIVNILLMFKMDYLFGKGIVVPYFIVMLTRLCTCASIQEPRHGNPLIATLILCNIKPVLTYRFIWAVNIFTSIVTDLALYIFSFTLIYCTITYYITYEISIF